MAEPLSFDDEILDRSPYATSELLPSDEDADYMDLESSPTPIWIQNPPDLINATLRAAGALPRTSALPRTTNHPLVLRPVQPHPVHATASAPSYASVTVGEPAPLPPMILPPALPPAVQSELLTNPETDHEMTVHSALMVNRKQPFNGPHIPKTKLSQPLTEQMTHQPAIQPPATAHTTSLNTPATVVIIPATAAAAPAATTITLATTSATAANITATVPAITTPAPTPIPADPITPVDPQVAAFLNFVEEDLQAINAHTAPQDAYRRGTFDSFTAPPPEGFPRTF
ncbi:hypothetical protein NEOLEDRAFT_1184285 [Neolentinus lepideus HHB14362 ss-1]|uniref:Uncharacterized protein n=1 Tax=Neolentinus lepideus HHB14362 ss-1 TaxID=1314782 RepID=A0A165MKQ1_9AGAM|nr:hypothetical protein NEOLEDRAFT_1184285 [Neolentinus lepideus HHB14362 ss-1]